MNPKFIEVCAGAGGFSSGFLNTGFTCVLLNEKDKTCCKTLEKNHPNIPISCSDMLELDLSPHKKIDVLLGGVPCQSFSQAGKRKGLDDSRGNLILVFAKMVKKYKPSVFIVENVKGLLTHNKGTTFSSILESFDKKNYNIEYKVLNAYNYGVAQKRERLFIVGTHKKRITKKFEWPEPCLNKLVLKDVLLPEPEDKEGINYSEEKAKVLAIVPPGGCWINLPEDIQKQYMKKSFESGGGKRGIARRLSYNEPSLTLTTSPCQKQTERCHPKYTRPFTVREYARIQSFPDDYEFCGTTNQKYKQIGNAVPVKLAERVAEQVLKLFTNF